MNRHNGAPPKLILASKDDVSKQMRREQEARRELDRLATLRPSDAAPLTDEDLDIFLSFDAAGEVFGLFAGAAYMDYYTFFVLTQSKAQMKQLQAFN